MNVALISDIHSNLEALTSVLADIERQDVDRIHCLGDVIGYGSDPVACLDLVREHCDLKLMGNHEYLVLGLESASNYSQVARTAATWTHQQLSERDLATIADFEMEHSIEDVYLVHASPCHPVEWRYILSPAEAAAAFEHLTATICFHGHTHIPTIFTDMGQARPKQRLGHSFEPNEDDRYLINIGSVGQPRDDDPRSCYVIYDTDTRQVTYRRVKYDVETAQGKMTEARLPSLLIDRLAVGQ